MQYCLELRCSGRGALLREVRQSGGRRGSDSAAWPASRRPAATDLCPASTGLCAPRVAAGFGHGGEPGGSALLYPHHWVDFPADAAL